MSAYTAWIDGVAQPLLLGSLSITAVANGVNNLQADIASTDGSYRPALDSKVIVIDDLSTDSPQRRMFGGYITSPSEQGLGADQRGPGDAAVQTTIAAADFNSVLTRLFLNETIPAGTLKQALQRVEACLADNGYTIALDSAQVDGPDLPELKFPYGDSSRLDAVLNQLSTLTATNTDSAYLWEVDYFEVLRMYLPGVVPAPFNIAVGDGDPVGDLNIVKSREPDYANRIIGISSGDPFELTDDFVGDGSTSTYPLTGVVDGYDSIIGTVEVTVSGTVHYEPVGTDPARWILDLAERPQTITRVDDGSPRMPDPPGVGDLIHIRYRVTSVVANDFTAQAAHGVWMAIVPLTVVDGGLDAQALADSILAKRKILLQQAKYTTRTDGLEPGQTQHIAVAIRNVDADFLIRSVTTRERADAPGVLDYEIEAVASASPFVIQGDFRDVYKAWLDSAQTGSTGVAGPTGALMTNDGGAPGPSRIYTNRTSLGYGVLAMIENPDSSQWAFALRRLDLGPDADIAIYNDAGGLIVEGKTRSFGWSGTTGVLYSDFLRLTATPYASLPASPVGGTIALIGDSQTDVWRSVVSAGGGPNTVLAIYLGGNWVVFAVQN